MAHKNGKTVETVATSTEASAEALMSVIQAIEVFTGKHIRLNQFGIEVKCRDELARPRRLEVKVECLGNMYKPRSNPHQECQSFSVSAILPFSRGVILDDWQIKGDAADNVAKIVIRIHGKNDPINLEAKWGYRDEICPEVSVRDEAQPGMCWVGCDHEDRCSEPVVTSS